MLVIDASRISAVYKQILLAPEVGATRYFTFKSKQRKWFNDEASHCMQRSGELNF